MFAYDWFFSKYLKGYNNIIPDLNTLYFDVPTDEYLINSENLLTDYSLKYGKTVIDTLKFSKRINGDIGKAIRLYKAFQDFGLTGDFYIKNKEVVVFRGYAGLRKYIEGTKYLETSEKLKSLKIDRNALKSSAKKNAAISVVITLAEAGYDISTSYLNDEPVPVAALVGHGSSLTKSMISSAASVGAGMGLAAIAATGIGVPVLLFVAVPILTGIAVKGLLDYSDKKIDATDNFYKAITGDYSSPGMVIPDERSPDLYQKCLIP